MDARPRLPIPSARLLKVSSPPPPFPSGLPLWRCLSCCMEVCCCLCPPPRQAPRPVVSVSRTGPGIVTHSMLREGVMQGWCLLIGIP